MNAEGTPSAPEDSQYQRYLALARELKASGRSIDDVLGALRAAGPYAIPSLKVLRELYGFSLADGKERLHAIRVWADEVPHWELLHEQLARVFLEHGTESDSVDPDQAG